MCKRGYEVDNSNKDSDSGNPAKRRKLNPPKEHQRPGRDRKSRPKSTFRSLFGNDSEDEKEYRKSKGKKTSMQTKFRSLFGEDSDVEKEPKKSKDKKSSNKNHQLDKKKYSVKTSVRTSIVKGSDKSCKEVKRQEPTSKKSSSTAKKSSNKNHQVDKKKYSVKTSVRSSTVKDKSCKEVKRQEPTAKKSSFPSLFGEDSEDEKEYRKSKGKKSEEKKERRQEPQEKKPANITPIPSLICKISLRDLFGECSDTEEEPTKEENSETKKLEEKTADQSIDKSKAKLSKEARRQEPQDKKFSNITPIPSLICKISLRDLFGEYSDDSDKEEESNAKKSEDKVPDQTFDRNNAKLVQDESHPVPQDRKSSTNTTKPSIICKISLSDLFGENSDDIEHEEY